MKKNENLQLSFVGKAFHQKVVAEIVGATPQIIPKWRRRFKNFGSSSLAAQKRGATFGDNHHFTTNQEKHLQKLITDNRPDQLKLA